MEHETSVEITRLRSYGRRRGRPLRNNQQHAFSDVLPRITVVPPQNPEKSRLTQAELDGQFPSTPSEIWLEIGFGGGEHMIAQCSHHADNNQSIGYIGCEPYVNGAAKAADAVHRLGLEYVRLWPDDARQLLDMLPDNCLSRVYILFADPWPKAKHNKRRLINTELFEDLARVMKLGGDLRIATDDPSYQVWILQHILDAKDFCWQVQTPKDWINPWPDHSQTRYEAKALKARRIPQYYRLTRNSQ